MFGLSTAYYDVVLLNIVLSYIVLTIFILDLSMLYKFKSIVLLLFL